MMTAASNTDININQSSSIQIKDEAKGYNVPSLPQPVLDDINLKLSKVQQFDPLRESILSRMKRLNGKLNSLENKSENIKEKSKIIGDIQQCLYDLQLIEHACHAPMLELSKTVFSLDKKRVHKKTTTVKTKSPKRRKNEISIDDFMKRRSGLETKIFGQGNSIAPTPVNYVEDNNYPESAHTQQMSQSQLTNESEEALQPSTSASSTNYPKRSNRFKRNVSRQRSFNNPKNYSPAFSPEHLLEQTKEDNEDCPTGRTKTPITVNSEQLSEDNHHGESGGPSASEKPQHFEQESVPEMSTSAELLLPQLSARPAAKKRAAAIAAASAVALDSARNVSPRKKTAVVDEESIAADEPTYCLCDQVSFGDMICCDYAQCSIEWFHFSCVGIKTKPKGKWYCPQCSVLINNRRNAAKNKHANARE